MAANTVTLESALEDVEARFLYNLPESELSQPDRLFFQIEQAWWFYEDFKADKYPHLPHFSKLQLFAKKVFSHCSILANYVDKWQELFADFSVYKSMIPVYGVIMLSPDFKKMVLVCSYKGNSWSFPRGKVNQNEGTLACAVREALEETGFDATDYCREEDSLVTVEGTNKIIKLYIACNVPETTIFETQTRKEISKIAFFPVDAMPSKTYGVFPFMQRLKRWIAGKQKAAGKAGRGSKSGGGSGGSSGAANTTAITSSSSNSSSSNAKQKAANEANQQTLPGFDGRNRDTFSDMLAAGSKGWDVQDMFKANQKLTGRNYSTYTGNPNEFGSTHPRYIDYSAEEERVAQRQSVLSAGARDNPTASKRNCGWPRFSSPFVLDRAAILAEVAAVVASTYHQTMFEDTEAFD